MKTSEVKQKLDSLRDNKNPLVIFGTGNYGALALHALKKHGIGIDYFCDNNRTNWGTQFYGYKVIPPEELLNAFPQAVVIIASLRFKYMTYQLRKNMNMRILNCDFLFTGLDLSGIACAASSERLHWMLGLYLFAIDAAQDKDKLKIKSLDVVVTEKCSLRCKNCSNLMQYYLNPRDADLSLMLSSFERFMANVDELYEARIIGGEPFMYKDLPPVMKKLSAYKNCRKVTILTNGTIIPKGEIVECLKDKKVSLIISDYGRLSKNLSGLKELLNKIKVPFIANNIATWQDCATIVYRERTNDQLTELFGDCCVNDALTLLHGKLYACPFSAHVNNLRAIPTGYDDENIDLRNLEDRGIKEGILGLYSGKKYLNACSFCAGRDYNVGNIEPVAQAASALPFKTYANNNKTGIL